MNPIERVEIGSTEEPRRMVRDWSREGTFRSIDESLGRLAMGFVDIIYIHDTFGDDPDLAIAGTYPLLAEMRDRGEIRAIGVGMGDCAILSRYARDCQLDCLLLWGSYSLLNFRALDELLPLCQDRGVDIVLGAPYESGILAADLASDQIKYRYHDAPQEIVDRARSVDAVCGRYGVPLKAAALQFVFGHPLVKTVIPGTRSPERLMENHRMLAYPLPRIFGGNSRWKG